jgi:hypothetical protein
MEKRRLQGSKTSSRLASCVYIGEHSTKTKMSNHQLQPNEFEMLILRSPCFILTHENEESIIRFGVLFLQEVSLFLQLLIFPRVYLIFPRVYYLLGNSFYSAIDNRTFIGHFPASSPYSWIARASSPDSSMSNTRFR